MPNVLDRVDLAAYNLSGREAAAEIDMPYSTLTWYCRRGDGPPYLQLSDGGQRRFNREQVIAWWNARLAKKKGAAA